MLDARTDVVGSLLRPPYLLAAQEKLANGELTPSAFKRVEDKAVDDALELQEEAGLAVVTDGEMRRLSFQSQLPAAVDGFAEWDLDAFLWGEWQSDELGELRVERPQLAVEQKLRRKRSLATEEFVYARGRTDRVVKVTLPSPSLFANFWDPQRSQAAYKNLEEFLADVAELLREEVDELVRLGAVYVQLDAPHYPLLVDPTYRRFYESRGWPASSSASSSTTTSSEITRASPSASTSAAVTRRAAGSSKGATTGSRSGCFPAFAHSVCCSSTTTRGPGRSLRFARFPTTRSSCSVW